MTDIRALAERAIQRAKESHERYKEGFASRNPGLASVPPPAGPVEDAAILARRLLAVLDAGEEMASWLHGNFPPDTRPSWLADAWDAAVRGEEPR